jgi:hypothetical protein
MHLSTNRKNYSNIPMKLGMGYLIFSMLLFCIGPISWPFISIYPILIYALIIFLSIFVSFNMGLRKIQPTCSDLRARRTIFFIGAIGAIGLLYPTAQVYTGRAPWQVFEALADQRDAYSRLREQLEYTRDVRGPIVLLRTILGPFTFAVLPLGIIYWKSMSSTMRALLIGTVISTMILSVLRGTTRELADVIIVGGAAQLVSMYRNSKKMPSLRQHWPKILLAILLVIGVLAALTGRTEARLAGGGASMCIGGGYVCPNFDAPIYKNFPPVLISAMASLTGYLSQGYYGLALALNQDFIPTWGLGHSPAMGSLYRSLTGDDTYFNATYIERLNQYVWTSDSHWSTAATWFASDVSFWGVPIVMGLIGFLWARSWVDAVYGGNDKAAIFFCVSMMMIFYFPANNQMMTTFDGYATTVFWGVSWLFSRHQSPSWRPAVTPGVRRSRG